MTDKKLTDEEIIKRLEQCVKRGNRNYDTDIVLDLINRQKSEIERLKGLQDVLKAEKHSVIKYTAYKEFAEKLKEKNFNFCINAIYDDSGEVKVIEINQSRFNKQIDNLLKEMVGEEE